MRYDPLNAFAHCFFCHQHLGGNPELFRDWALEQLGEGAIQILRERQQDTNLGKLVRKAKKQVAFHYKSEYDRMKQLRAEGMTGRIEVIGYV